jgi:cytidyltransferase-like protein
MTRVFVSGCYDILHGGHIEFFKQARAFGGHLTVCFASDEVYRAWKGREPALPEDSRWAILKELRCVDEVVMSTMPPTVVPIFMDFARYAYGRADVLVVTDDESNAERKKTWCKDVCIRFVQVPKQSHYASISTTEIRERIAK